MKAATQEAVREAKRRWGDKAHVENDKGHVRVGILRTSGMEVLGEGGNYTRAFRNADDRAFVTADSPSAPEHVKGVSA